MTRRLILDGPTATTSWHYTVRAGDGASIIARTSAGVTLGSPADHLYADVEIDSGGELLVTWDNGTESVTERIAAVPSAGGSSPQITIETTEVTHA